MMKLDGFWMFLSDFNFGEVVGLLNSHSSENVKYTLRTSVKEWINSK